MSTKHYMQFEEPTGRRAGVDAGCIGQQSHCSSCDREVYSRSETVTILRSDGITLSGECLRRMPKTRESNTCAKGHGGTLMPDDGKRSGHCISTCQKELTLSASTTGVAESMNSQQIAPTRYTEAVM